MSEQDAENGDDYVAISKEAARLLPPEWRQQFTECVDDGRKVLKSVDRDLSALSRLTNSLFTLATLKHVQARLLSWVLIALGILSAIPVTLVVAVVGFFALKDAISSRPRAIEVDEIEQQLRDIPCVGSLHRWQPLDLLLGTRAGAY
ncbi:hypothetical protein [Phenylobacterium sp.]|uniref:hypothetical protein n=1 Tax=Phenylobacterium sp. TaxID=1871053 RepID=UPI004035975B